MIAPTELLGELPEDETTVPPLTLNRYYVTFGQKYSYEIHPNFPDAHPDGVVEVSAVDESAARTIVVDKLGDKWCFIYPSESFDFNLYPLGVLAIL